VDDSFGFNKMFAKYGFTALFAPTASAGTTVRIETFYTPASPIAAALNTPITRRKLRHVVDGLLAGLRELAERRHAGHCNRDRPHPLR
jgi:hypothetical protein